jgi:hypothetical protein
MAEHDKVPIMPSAPSAFSPKPISDQFPPKCYHCNVNRFTTKDQYEEHGIRFHKNLPCYPGFADIESLGLEPQGMQWEIDPKIEVTFDGEETKN